MNEMPLTARWKLRLSACDDGALNILANGALSQERLIGKVVGLCSHLALGAVCYPLYVVLFSLWPQGRALIAQVAAADIAGLVVLMAFRYATRRQRPPRRRDHKYIIPWNNYSFPSGHAVRAFAIAVVLTVSGPAWCVLTLPVACVIALSRVTLARHYPSDVLAGVGIGVLSGLVCTLLS
jgi:undecaprenyl-diphosphatase